MFKLSASAQDRPKTGWLLFWTRKPCGFRISDWMDELKSSPKLTGQVDFGFLDWTAQLKIGPKAGRLLFQTEARWPPPPLCLSSSSLGSILFFLSPPASLTFFALDLSSDFLFAYFAGNTRPGPVFNLFSEISICHSIHWDFQSNSHFHSFQCQWASSPLKLSRSTFHFHSAYFAPAPIHTYQPTPIHPIFRLFVFNCI